MKPQNYRKIIVSEMQRQGVTHYRLAKLSGVSQSAITDLVNKAGYQLKTGSMEKIAAVLGLKLSRS